MPRGRPFLLWTCMLLAGCAQYWAKPGGTTADLSAARTRCEDKANAAFPPLMQPVQVAGGTPSPMVTTCAPAGGSVACSTAGTGFWAPVTTTLDQNIGPRRQAVDACLADAGWTAARSRGEATSITNSGQ